MSTKLDAESYLKSGSNELRILEYRTGGLSFGINILKVSKIVNKLNELTKMPESHESVSGVFRDMQQLIPVVDLASYLGIKLEDHRPSKVIVTEFFGTHTGFWVDQIDWIHHFKWQDVIDASEVMGGIDNRYVLGIVKPTEERMVLLLDYETILLDLCPNLRAKDEVTYQIKSDLSGKSILVVEDSPAVRSMLVNELTDLGFEVQAANDGVKGWELFQQTSFDLVICDVEMPQMDGLALTLQIRQSDRGETPVIVYSSIGDVGMKARAEFLKANAHITKLNFDLLLETAEKLMNGEKVSFDAVSPELPEITTSELVEID